MMTNAEYAELKEPQCPYCHSRDVKGINEHESSGNEIWIGMTCNNCNEKWTETYKLTGFTPRA